MGDAVDLARPRGAELAIRRALSRLYRDWGFRESGCHTIPDLLAFLGWTFLVRAGLARKRILVMNCAEGREGDGFYAQFTVILGLLEHFERWRKVIAGVRVDFGEWALYFDSSVGTNSWEYFFEPIDIRQAGRAVERVVEFKQGERFSVRGEVMRRSRAHELIARYVHVKPHVRAKIDAFVTEHFGARKVIGVHYRGTDKWQEARRVPYEEIRAVVRSAVGTCGSGDCLLFVASDEQAFVDFMAHAFPGRVVAWETHRAADLEPIDMRFDDNYKKGEDVVIDCLLLSRCHRLIRTSSTLSLCSSYFNPDIPVEVLNLHYSGLQPSSR